MAVAACGDPDPHPADVRAAEPVAVSSVRRRAWLASPTLTECVRTGSGGNPFLKPLRFEQLRRQPGILFLADRLRFGGRFPPRHAGLHRQPRLPVPGTRSGNRPAAHDQRAGQHQRGAGSRADEAQVSTFFDWGWRADWARGFGAQANVTYIDAKAEFLIVPSAGRRDGDESPRIPDVSKWTYNLVGMYEARGPDARLAYNNRSGFPEGALADDAIGRRLHTSRAAGIRSARLDWSSSYAFSDNLTLFFDWTNILEKAVPLRHRADQLCGAASRSRAETSRWSCASRNR